MEPALRLASLMLSEKCMFPWFGHLTFGHRRCDKLTHPPRVYIAVNKGEHDEARKQEIQRKLRKMSRFITLGSLPANVMILRMESLIDTESTWKGIRNFIQMTFQ